MKQAQKRQVCLKRVEPPAAENLEPVFLLDSTMEERKQKVLSAMEKQNFDCLFIYGDLEHGANFEYLTGFLPRFEEAILVLHRDGKAFLLLGNENMKMAAHSRIPAEAIQVPAFSLPNQPSCRGLSVTEALREANIGKALSVGVCGWKLLNENSQEHPLLDIPHYIGEAIKRVIPGNGKLANGTELLIHPGRGVRITNNSNEIAHYEFGSALSGNCVLHAMDHIEPGKSEMEIGHYLNAWGQANTVVSVCAAGKRFSYANLYPGMKKINLGDPISLTTGFKGGLTSRCGYAVNDTSQLPDNIKDYLERVAIPYYQAMAAWLEQIRIGMSGGELYQLIESVLPASQYGWYLNPGHYTADEEWLSSPVRKNSPDILQSGTLLQADIIPSVEGYGGAGAESGIALADEALQKELEARYPSLWKRIINRRRFMEQELGLSLHREVLPLSVLTGYYRPFFLAKNQAFVITSSA